MQGLHGSYSRYGFADHLHPVHNPHFPPAEMIDGLRRDLLEITRNLTVGQLELARLAANWTGVDPSQIVVGNGASELIKIIGEHFIEQLAIPVPAFNEYANVVHPGRLTRFWLEPPTFDLEIDAFAEAAVASRANIAAVITPNIPTARSIERDDVLTLARRLEEHNCRLIVDESFIEYSRLGRKASVATALDEHQNLAVLKSMSKTYGVAGLRIGYLLSADRQFVDAVRSRLPIWNVNGMAEAFLRRVGSYRSAFDYSCALVRETYQALYEQLCAVPGIDALEPDANFVLCRVTTPRPTGPEVDRRLYVTNNILVKHCAFNTMPEAERYLRIGSRTMEDNRRLVTALARLRLGRS